MIFYDVAYEKQDHIKAYLCMGRDNNMDIKHAYNDHINTDMPYNLFRQLCSKCWNRDKYRFIVIDKGS